MLKNVSPPLFLSGLHSFNITFVCFFFFLLTLQRVWERSFMGLLKWDCGRKHHLGPGLLRK